MAIYRDQGIVLRTMRYGEADRIVSLLTQCRGKVRAIIKGVRKTKSRFGARLEPFGHVDLLLYEGRSDLHVVSQAELLTPFERIRTDFDAYTCAQLFCEAAEKVTPDYEPNVRLVLLLLAGLRTLDARVRRHEHVPHVLRGAFLLKLLGVSGFGPALRACVLCGEDEGLTAFSLSEGGVTCGACRQAGDVPLEPAGIWLLQRLWRTPLEDIPDVHSGEVDGLLQRAVEYHLERRLRSLELRSF